MICFLIKRFSFSSELFFFTLMFAFIFVFERGSTSVNIIPHISKIWVTRVDRSAFNGLDQDSKQLINQYTKLTNRYILHIIPVLGRKRIETIIKQIQSIFPNLLEKSHILEDGLIDVQSIIYKEIHVDQRDSLTMICRMFTRLISLFLDAYGMVISNRRAREAFHQCFEEIQHDLKTTPTAYKFIVQSLPFGIAEEEKIEFLSAAEIHERYRKRTLDFLSSEERYQALFHYAGTAIFVCNPENQLIDLNQKACEFLDGYYHDFIHKSVGEVFKFSQKDLKSFIYNISTLFDHRGYIVDNYVLTKPNGELCNLDITSTGLYEENQLHAIINICHDITERTLIQKEYQTNVSLLQATLESIREGILVLDNGSEQINYNQKFLTLWNLSNDEGTVYTRASVEKRFREEIIDADLFLNLFTQSLFLAPTDPLLIRLKNGKTFECAAQPHLLNQQVIGVVWNFMDVTRHRAAMEQVERSLNEKEILLQEIHHRVKNNLQIISSLLSIHSRAVTQQEVIQSFEDCNNRVKAMSLIHDRLYNSRDFSRVDFRAYTERLINQLMTSYGYDLKKLHLILSIEDIYLSIKTAVPCGLLINELVTNVLKYAFPKEKSGCITIQFIRLPEKYYQLIIKDDGIGIPAHIQLNQSETLGLQLVSTLISQLKGKVELNRSAGIEFIITFPEDDAL